MDKGTLFNVGNEVYHYLLGIIMLYRHVNVNVPSEKNNIALPARLELRRKPVGHWVLRRLCEDLVCHWQAGEDAR